MKRPDTLKVITTAAIQENEPCDVGAAIFFNNECMSWIAADIAQRNEDLRNLESQYFQAVQQINDAQGVVRDARIQYGALVNAQGGLTPANQSAWLTGNPPAPTSGAIEGAQRAVAAAEAQVDRLSKAATAIGDKRAPILAEIQELRDTRAACQRRISQIAKLMHPEPINDKPASMDAVAQWKA